MSSARRGSQAGRRGGATRLVNYISLAGEFFVLGELALRRLDASLTLGHTKEIDILVLNRATGRTFKVEVKTTERGVRGSGIFGLCYAWLMDDPTRRVCSRSSRLGSTTTTARRRTRRSGCGARRTTARWRQRAANSRPSIQPSTATSRSQARCEGACV